MTLPDSTSEEGGSTSYLVVLESIRLGSPVRQRDSDTLSKFRMIVTPLRFNKVSKFDSQKLPMIISRENFPTFLSFLFSKVSFRY